MFPFERFTERAKKVLARLYEHALGERPWMLRLRSTWWFRLGAVLGTFVLVAIGWVMLRCETWAGGWIVERAWLGGVSPGETHWLPMWVPVLPDPL